MTDFDPPRLGDPGSNDSALVAALLRDARADLGTDSDVNTLRAALGVHLWPDGPPSGGAEGGAGTGGAPAGTGASSTVATGGAALGMKAGLGALLVVAAAGTWFATRTDGPAEHPANSVHTETTPAHINPDENPMRSAPSAILNPDSPAPTDQSGIIAVAPSGPSSTPPPARPAHDAAPTESALLGQAQAALARNASLALSLSEQHRAWYPRGMLVQEREVIAIEALKRLGRQAEASARAARFLKVFPRSAHRSKIESLVPPR